MPPLLCRNAAGPLVSGRSSVTRTSGISGRPRGRKGAARKHGLARDRRSTVALEFAILAVPLFVFMLFILELSYDLFTQEALDAGVHQAARQIQTGNAQNAQNANDFITKYLCPDLHGLLECGSRVYIKVTKLGFTGSQDFWTYTDGKIPTVGNTLNLVGYQSGDFCNSGPSQLLLVSAIYIGPSLVGGLLPRLFSVTYNGSPVHATLSTTGMVTEGYPPVGVISGGAAPSC